MYTLAIGIIGGVLLNQFITTVSNAYTSWAKTQQERTSTLLKQVEEADKRVKEVLANAEANSAKQLRDSEAKIADHIERVNRTIAQVLAAYTKSTVQTEKGAYQTAGGLMSNDGMYMKEKLAQANEDLVAQYRQLLEDVMKGDERVNFQSSQ